MGVPRHGVPEQLWEAKLEQCIDDHDYGGHNVNKNCMLLLEPRRHFCLFLQYRLAHPNCYRPYILILFCVRTLSWCREFRQTIRIISFYHLFCLMYVLAPCARPSTHRTRGGHLIPWNRSYRQLWVTIWMLGTQVLCKNNKCPAEPALAPTVFSISRKFEFIFPWRFCFLNSLTCFVYFLLFSL